MKPGIPWSVKGIEPEAREAAKHAARRSGMTLGEWLNSVILDQADANEPSQAAAETIPQKDFSSGFRRAPEAAAGPRQDDTVIRLEDIAQQLSRIARREQESAAIRPYEAPAQHEDSATLHRILDRVEGNERQTVEAFSAVNERLSVLGRQIAMSSRQKAIEKPEDVPGYPALETAIRNVVDHIEVSDKLTRDQFKSMQDRLGDMTQRASHAASGDVLQAAPAFVSLETRLNDLASRVQRSEQAAQSGLPDLVRRELEGLAGRIDNVREASETLASQAHSAAAATAQKELRDIEGRILTLLKEAQTAFASQPSSADLQRLRAEIGSLNQRIDDVKSGTASDRDVHALRVAVEQLSTRVAQGPDMRPLADMDRRLGEITDRLEQAQTQNRNLPQLGELERRIAELDHRLAEAVRLQGDGRAVAALEQQLAAVNDRIGRAEQQLGHFDTIERAINQLFEGLEQNRNIAREAAEDAANRMADRLIAAQQPAPGPSPEMQALQDGLRAVRESAASSDQRSQETLEAVHETLEQIVSKLAELETAAAGHQLAVNMAQPVAERPQAAPAWHVPPPNSQPEVQPPSQPFFDPASAFQDPLFEAPVAPANPSAAAPVTPDFSGANPPQQQPPIDFSIGGGKLSAGDDFIAAARRAAQAAANKTNVLSAEIRPALRPGANRRFKFSLPFMKGGNKPQPQPMSFSGGKPVPQIKPAISNDTTRRKLLLAGLVLLAAVSAFTFNMMMKQPKPVKQSSSIETTVKPVLEVQAPQARAATQDKQAVILPDPTGDGSALSAADVGPVKPRAKASDGVMVDAILTGALPARKTDASLASIVTEPGPSAETAEMAPQDLGSRSLRDAAARGDATAQFIVASRYLDGQNVQQDFTKAAYWYQQAASRGLAPAQYRLATLFERGKGVPQDAATALLWYERAADAGNVKSMHNAAVIAAGNQAGTPNYDKAFKWFSKAARSGLKDSQFNLAVLYERGLGTKIDPAEALLWYTLAGKQGDQDAEKRAGQLAKTLAALAVKSVSDRTAAWKPEPAVDDANIVAVTNQEWNAPANAAAAPIISIDPVLAAQQLLANLGFNVGEPDGKMGARTANAIRLFQLQSGLKVTGEVTPDLISAMRAKAG